MKRLFRILVVSLILALLVVPVIPVSAAVPTISTFTPASGYPNTTVTITGTGFYDGGATSKVVSVLFGDTPAASYTVHSDTVITAIVGAGSTGLITVVTSGGTVTSAAAAPDTIFTITIPQPINSAQTVTKIHFNRSLYQPNDVLVYGMYNLPYNAIPSTSAGSAFNFYLVDTAPNPDVVYAMANFYAFHDSGYNHGLIAMYLPAGVITWGATYKIRIEEVDTQFTAPVDVDVTIPATAYSTEVTQEANQEELGRKLMDISKTLEAEFNEDFFTSSDNGQILTDRGQKYFVGCISGLEVMAPQLFLFQKLPVEWETGRVFTTALFDSYQNRFDNTWVGAGQDAAGGLFGISGNMFMSFIILLLCCGAVLLTNILYRKTTPGLRIALLILIMGALLGWFSTPLFAIIFQLLGIYVGYLLFYARSGDELGHRLLSFIAFSYFVSVLICVILEGTFFQATETNIFYHLSFFTKYPLPLIGNVPVLSADFLDAVGKIITWDYSFYTGSWIILRFLWIIITTIGVVWGLAKFFIPIIPSIIAIFRPSVSI